MISTVMTRATICWITVSSRMRSVREGDTLARLGGDEFVAVLLDLYDERNTPTLGRLLAAVAEPVDFRGAVFNARPVSA